MFGKIYFIDLKHKVMIQKQKGIFCARLLDSAIDEKLFFQNSTERCTAILHGRLLWFPFFCFYQFCQFCTLGQPKHFFFISDVMGHTLHPGCQVGIGKNPIFGDFVLLWILSNFQLPTALSKTKIGIIKWLHILWIWPEKYFSAQKNQKFLPFIF